MMLRLAWKLAKRLWSAACGLPRQAAAALSPVDPQQPYTDGRLWRAILVVGIIALGICWAFSQFVWVRSPSINAHAVRPAPGPIGRDDLVMYMLRHPLAGPVPVNVTKYALCLPGDLLAAYILPSEEHPDREEAAFFCNGTLLGVSKPYGREGQRLDFFRWRTGRIPAGKVYIGSSYKDGFDSRYFGLVPLSALTRMERAL